MKRTEILLKEILQEAKATRKLLERVPLEKGEYKPHEKSMSLSRLATHVAEIPGWWKECFINNELDFSVGDFKPKVFNNTAELLAFYDDLMQKATIILQNTDDSELDNMWTMRNGEQIYFTMPKFDVVRTWCMNHWYHHRAQLTVYLRMLEVPLPSIYGPSADDMGS